MKLSVIIVSYNVSHFLDQCLHSVQKAAHGLDVEVFVVDNASVDHSVQMVQQKYPEVRCIANTQNVGFSVANNQAIRMSKGEYVLLLNPDTLVETDTFSKCLHFMEAHPEAGGLGVRMVDGSGRFLPESKRGLPTPSVAFFKIFGLSFFFPHSKLFNRYHLGYLDEHKTHEVDILSGAFMWLRHSVLDKIGLLDETFFMYGEDIDLSYRIQRGGYHNYYFPDTRIIHYKGESTKKGSLNYVFVFYRAMIIFARKHFSPKNAKLFSFLINLAIYFRASISVLSRLFRVSLLPLSDAILLYGGLLAIARMLENKVIYPQGGHYPTEVYWLALPLLCIAWMAGILFSGGYDKPVSVWKTVRGILSATILVLVVYALMPESYRYSRTMIVVGSLLGLLSTSLIRFAFHLLRIKGLNFRRTKLRRYFIVGQPQEAERVAGLLHKIEEQPGYIGKVNPDVSGVEEKDYVGDLSRLADLIGYYKVDEVVFCARDLPAEQIIDLMSDVQHTQVDFKIAPPESLSIIGSNHISTAGDLYIFGLNSVGRSENRRLKRLFDLLAGIFILVTSPVTFFLFRNPFRMLLNSASVILGMRSITGYCPNDGTDQRLPKLRKGVIYPTDIIRTHQPNGEEIAHINRMYARNYSLVADVRLLLGCFRKLDRES